MRSWPFGVTTLDLAALGYEAEEVELAGVARRYRRGAGEWQAEVAGEAPFRTRLLVYRPLDAARSNGAAVVHWNNVSMGHDLVDDVPAVFQDGFTFIGVSAQRVGLEHLRAWDPARYHHLVHPGDDYSFDIFTRAVRWVRGRGGIDRTLAMGSSQSAGRLATYVNAVQPEEQAVDGFLLQLYFGTATPLEVGESTVDLAAPDFDSYRRSIMRGRHRFRDDLDVPVLVVNSELEAIAMHRVRQPDDRRFRLWEAAGTAHTSRPSEMARADRLRRDGLTPAAPRPGMNEISMAPLFDEALRSLHAWVRTGEPPPSRPRIEFAGDPPQIVRDEIGIACGGIRLPELASPTAVHSSEPIDDGVVGWLSGRSVPLERTPRDTP